MSTFLMHTIYQITPYTLQIKLDNLFGINNFIMQGQICLHKEYYFIFHSIAYKNIQEFTMLIVQSSSSQITEFLTMHI